MASSNNNHDLKLIKTQNSKEICTQGGHIILSCGLLSTRDYGVSPEGQHVTTKIYLGTSPGLSGKINSIFFGSQPEACETAYNSFHDIQYKWKSLATRVKHFSFPIRKLRHLENLPYTEQQINRIHTVGQRDRFSCAFQLATFLKISTDIPCYLDKLYCKIKLLPISLTEEPPLHHSLSLFTSILAQTEVKHKDTVRWTEMYLSETQGRNTDFNRFRPLLPAFSSLYTKFTHKGNWVIPGSFLLNHI